MKKITLILLISFSSSVFAQIDIGIPGADTNKENDIKLQIAKKNAEYNGYIVGYAKACNFSPADYQRIESLLFKNLNTVELTNTEVEDAKQVYQQSVYAAQKKGQTHSKIECSLFGEEFKKIVEAINGNPPSEQK